MTPERRKAVWAIYGKLWIYLSLSVLETNLLNLVCEVAVSHVLLSPLILQYGAEELTN